MPWRAYFITLIAMMALLVLAVQAIKSIWPPERHPLAIDARALECPRIGPLRPDMIVRPAPIMDPRRNA